MSKLQTVIIKSHPTSKKLSTIMIDSNQCINNIKLKSYIIDLSTPPGEPPGDILYLQFIDKSPELCPLGSITINNSNNNVLLNTIPIINNASSTYISRIFNQHYIDYSIRSNCCISNNCKVHSTNQHKIKLEVHLKDSNLKPMNFQKINLVLEIYYQ